mgnify:CR=1 FL=1
MAKNTITLSVDFDGTMVADDFPRIGRNIGAEYAIRYLANRGFKIVLFTVRGGEYLKEAIKWCDENGIQLLGINVNKEVCFWADSPKVYADLYIDDRNVGSPLTADGFVDWVGVLVEIREKYSFHCDWVGFDDVVEEIRKAQK